MRLNYRRTFLLGSAFFGVQVLFAIYTAYVPIFLQAARPDFAGGRAVQGGFSLNTTLTGLIMALDNLAAMLILPYIGARSDTTISRMGKRKPYILVGTPITALAFAAIPLLLGHPLWMFIGAVIVMILAVDVIRAPIFALMPDITPSPLRSQANGVINVMGGIGAMVAFAVGGALYQRATSGPFFFAAGVLLAACYLVVFALPVPVSSAVDSSREQVDQHEDSPSPAEQPPTHELHSVFHYHDRSLLYLLATIFCLFLAYSALTVFFTSYAIINLRVPRGQEAQLLAFWALAIVGFAIPGGLLASRIGRKHTILLGIVIFTVATTPIALLTALPTIRGLLIMSGLGWALIVVNAFPMVLDSAAPERLVGTYTGMYFLATQLAEVVGPLLVGGFLDLTGRDYRLIFLYTLIVMLLAGGLLLRVRGGEACGELDR